MKISDLTDEQWLAILDEARTNVAKPLPEYKSTGALDRWAELRRRSRQNIQAPREPKKLDTEIGRRMQRQQQQLRDEDFRSQFRIVKR